MNSATKPTYKAPGTPRKWDLDMWVEFSKLGSLLRSPNIVRHPYKKDPP